MVQENVSLKAGACSFLKTLLDESTVVPSDENFIQKSIDQLAAKMSSTVFSEDKDYIAWFDNFTSDT